MDEKKRRAVFDHYRNITDVLVLQETHSSRNVENLWQNEWGGGKLSMCMVHPHLEAWLFLCQNNSSRM